MLPSTSPRPTPTPKSPAPPSGSSRSPRCSPTDRKLLSATIFTTAALLVSYRRHGTDWWDYLNTFETALETAAPQPEDVEPAVLLLTRRKRALGKSPAHWPAMTRGISVMVRRSRSSSLTVRCSSGTGDLDQQPLPHPGLAVHRGDRVQRHLRQQPNLRVAEPAQRLRASLPLTYSATVASVSTDRPALGGLLT